MRYSSLEGKPNLQAIVAKFLVFVVAQGWQWAGAEIQQAELQVDYR